jgi:hypothetical protein
MYNILVEISVIDPRLVLVPNFTEWNSRHSTIGSVQLTTKISSKERSPKLFILK